MSRKDYPNLLAIIDCCQKILTFVGGSEDIQSFKKDDKTFDAVLMNFIVIGETASKLSSALTDEFDHIPWHEIRALRNVIAHDYFGVNPEEIWQTIQSDIPNFIEEIQKIVS